MIDFTAMLTEKSDFGFQNLCVFTAGLQDVFTDYRELYKIEKYIYIEKIYRKIF